MSRSAWEHPSHDLPGIITSLPGEESEILTPYHTQTGTSAQHTQLKTTATATSAKAATTTTMSKASSDTAPTVLVSDLKLVDDNNDDNNCYRPSGSLGSSTQSSSSSSSSTSISGRSLAKAIEDAHLAASSRENIGTGIVDDELASIETPYNQTPYVVQEKRVPRLEPYVQQSLDLYFAQGQQPQQQDQEQEVSKPSKQSQAPKPVVRNQLAHPHLQQQPPPQPHPMTSHHRRPSQRIPRVTSASVPFEKTVPPTSFLRDELAKDPAYRHALKAGTLWQSLVGQHVKLPALWYDGEEPARPYLGCEDPLKRNKWSYFGRHRVAGDPKLSALVRHPESSGKLLLHVVCRDSKTLAPTEDLVVGVFHPSAPGIREGDGDLRRHEDCRDVWIGHRSRSVPHRGRRVATRIESLLHFLHKHRVDKSPLGGGGGEGSKKRSVDNTNMNSIFGSRPPRHTLFVPEATLHDLLLPRKGGSHSPPPPASVVLLRTFLR